MRLSITCHIEKAHLVWAAFKVIDSGVKPTKAAVMRYLRHQLEMFGTDDDSLFGSNYENEMEEPAYAEAYLWVSKAYPNMN